MPKAGALTAAAAAIAVGAIVGAGTAQTYAAWSDRQDITGNQVSAGVWIPDPPAACGPISDYKGGVVYGTIHDDVIDLRDANQSQIVIGAGGNDTIYGGNSGDCLVGNDGNDVIVGGNAKDILIGGPGDDTLDGGNAPDVLDPGSDAGDVCDGGNGKNTIIGTCESTP